MSKRYSKESNLKISNTLMGHITSKITRRKIQSKIKELWQAGHYDIRKKRNLSGKNNPMYGKSGKLSPAWKGGKSFEPYTLKFNNKLKEKIRKRDENKCQILGGCRIKSKQVLSIHHIDYSKKNNNDFNLITLCKGHNNKVNFNREFWQDYFQRYQKLRAEFGVI